MVFDFFEGYFMVDELVCIGEVDFLYISFDDEFWVGIFFLVIYFKKVGR